MPLYAAVLIGALLCAAGIACIFAQKKGRLTRPFFWLGIALITGAALCALYALGAVLLIGAID